MGENKKGERRVEIKKREEIRFKKKSRAEQREIRKRKLD